MSRHSCEESKLPKRIIGRNLDDNLEICNGDAAIRLNINSRKTHNCSERPSRLLKNRRPAGTAALRQKPPFELVTFPRFRGHWIKRLHSALGYITPEQAERQAA
jgi:hypothetical protein